MTSKTLIKLAASSLLLGTAMVSTQSLAEATFAGVEKAEKVAAKAIFRAEGALAARDADRAVRYAEEAVAAAPNESRYRATLGQAYLLAGRFTSAEASFTDVLALDPSNGRAALSLALSQIALARNGEALATLNAITVPVAQADLGLARALAGDTAGALEILTAAARAPDADAKTRQNLALSLALAGKWNEARTVAAQDVSPAELDQRIVQWAKFTQPTSSWDQVAALLGVVPAEDPGQPVRLALAQPEPVRSAAVATPLPLPAPVVEAPVAVAVARVVQAPVVVEAPVVVAVAPSIPAPTPSHSVPVTIAASRLPEPAYRPATLRAAPLIRRQTAAVKLPAAQKYALVKAPKPTLERVALARPGKGKFVVQLGAFSTRTNVELAWSKARSRFAQLASYSPSSANFSTTANASLYRLSVGGFETRAQAVRLCEAVRAKGNPCFVRAVAGDAPAQWVSRDKGDKKAVRLASK